jgi:hypothetical protein
MDNVITVDGPEIGHPQIVRVLKFTDFCGDERAALYAVLIENKSSKRRSCLDPEDARFQDCQLYGLLKLPRAMIKHIELCASRSYFGRISRVCCRKLIRTWTDQCSE